MTVVVSGRFAGLRSVDVWWPSRAADVGSQLARTPVVCVRQCERATADALLSAAFRRRPSPTLLVDLDRPVEELWEGLHAKSCRAKIRKAEDAGVRFLRGERVDEAMALIDADLSRRGYSRPLSPERRSELLRTADVFAVAHDERILAAHVFLADGRRARLLHSASAERSGRDEDRLIGWANRYLHWQEMLSYKEQGVGVYDFGGIDLDPASPLHSISQFKLSFGGRIVPEESVYLASRVPLRGALRAASKGRLVLRRALRRA